MLSYALRFLGILTVVLPALACQPMEEDQYALTPSLDTTPIPGAAEPPPGPLSEAQRLTADGDSKEVVKLLSKWEAVTPLEKAWHRLLLGEAWFALGVQDKAIRLLLANYEELRDVRPAPEPALQRVMARSLKRLGTYQRERHDYEKAYTLHQLQWLYLKRVGSLGERHEALLSLDMDASLLRNYFASEQWLKEAQQVALQMPEGPDRQRALIITWNNLSATLQEVLRFPEAEAAAREAKRIAQIYDAKSGRSEFREVWATAQYADVVEAWANYTETKEPAQARPLHTKAQGLARGAVQLAEQNGLDGNERMELEQRMRKICGQYCKSPPPVIPGVSE